MYTEFLNFSLVQFENVLGSCRSGADYKMPNLYFSGESNDVILVLDMLTLESRCIRCVARVGVSDDLDKNDDLMTPNDTQMT